MELLTTVIGSTESLSGLIYEKSFMELGLRFLINLLVTIFVINYVYFRATGRKSYVFTYILISTTVFFLCFLLASIELQLGFALGLFAIFGIIRYRTDPVPIREMTYLFLVITISVINALARNEVSYWEIGFSNLSLMVTTWVMENIWMTRRLARRTIIYDRLDLIHPGKALELINDIKERTGINVANFKIGQIDLSKKSVRITVFYMEQKFPRMLSDAEMSEKNVE